MVLVGFNSENDSLAAVPGNVHSHSDPRLTLNSPPVRSDRLSRFHESGVRHSKRGKGEKKKKIHLHKNSASILWRLCASQITPSQVPPSPTSGGPTRHHPPPRGLTVVKRLCVESVVKQCGVQSISLALSPSLYLSLIAPAQAHFQLSVEQWAEAPSPSTSTTRSLITS